MLHETWNILPSYYYFKGLFKLTAHRCTFALPALSAVLAIQTLVFNLSLFARL